MEKVCLLVRFQLLVSLLLILSAENCGRFVFIRSRLHQREDVCTQNKRLVNALFPCHDTCVFIINTYACISKLSFYVKITKAVYYYIWGKLLCWQFARLGRAWCLVGLLVDYFGWCRLSRCFTPRYVSYSSYPHRDLRKMTLVSPDHGRWQLKIHSLRTVLLCLLLQCTTLLLIEDYV